MPGSTGQHVPLLKRNRLNLINRSGGAIYKIIRPHQVFEVSECGDKCRFALVTSVDVSQVMYVVVTSLGENSPLKSL